MYKNKYLKYKSKYLELKFENEINQYINSQIGGSKFRYNVDDTYNNDDILQYIKNRFSLNKESFFSSAPIKTTNKYFVIIYGPFSSNNIIAKKIAQSIILKTESNLNFNFKNLNDTFMDTNIDELFYDLVSCDNDNKCNKISDILNKNLNELKIDDISKKNLEELTIINNIIDAKYLKSIKLFKDNYETAQSVSNLILDLAKILKKNIFFETYGTNDTIESLYKNIDSIIKDKYIPIIIFPYCNKNNIYNIYTTILSHDINLFLKKTDIEKSISQSDNNFTKLIENYNKDNKDNSITILKYNINNPDIKKIETNNDITTLIKMFNKPIDNNNKPYIEFFLYNNNINYSKTSRN